jgi:proteasome lid subunit RPN8/RPN11
MQAAAEAHHPNEIGGILVGVFVHGRRPWITAAPVVEPEESGHNFYVLPEGGRPLAVDSARKQDTRLGYLGDWHSHPSDVSYSDKDLTTIRMLALDLRAHCRDPLLLIARRCSDSYLLDAWQFSGHRLRAQRIIAAGDLLAESVKASI